MPPTVSVSPQIDDHTVRRLAALSTGALTFGYLPIAWWERRMRATGGSGIIGLQLAPDARAASALMTAWGPEGRRAATEQTWADFVWMHTYGLTGACLVELARRRTRVDSGWSRSGLVVRWLPHTAVALDVVEGVGQLRSLRSWADPSERTVALTRSAATAKYVLLVGASLWALAAATIGARADRVRVRL